MYGLIVAEVTSGYGGQPWVARLTGFDPVYQFRREFLRGTYDYSRAFKSRRRGVYLYFAVPPGIYDVWENHYTRGFRYFARVTDDGDVIKISREEVIACLNASLN